MTGTFQSIFNETEVIREKNWLIVRFPQPQVALSWAVVGGGRTVTQIVAWYQVTGRELRPPVDPRQFLRKRLEETTLSDAVGLLTNGNLDQYVNVKKTNGEYSARCIATVGLSNALRVGDPPGGDNPVGTINLLCQLSLPLSYEAMIEAIGIASEARTVAVLETSLPSTRTRLPATGTGTDCIVIAGPESEEGAPYAGKHTPVGCLIGASVLEATRLGIERWKHKSKISERGDKK